MQREEKLIESFAFVDFSEMTWPMITIYENPSDYPDLFVARIFDITAGFVFPTNTFITRKSLEDVRMDIMAAGFITRLEREACDDPAIKETWMR